MNELIVCSSCTFRFPNNPMKHRNRPKLCPKCGTRYTKKKRNWKPNLNWLKEKMWRKEERILRRQQKYYQRASHNLRLRFRREPTELEIQREMIWMMMREGKLTEEQAEKQRKKVGVEGGL